MKQILLTQWENSSSKLALADEFNKVKHFNVILIWSKA